jgi:hypothetical protein
MKTHHSPNLFVTIIVILFFVIGVSFLLSTWFVENKALNITGTVSLTISCSVKPVFNFFFYGNPHALTENDEHIFTEIQSKMEKYDENKSCQSMEEPWDAHYFDDLFLLENRLGDQKAIFGNKKLHKAESSLKTAIADFASLEIQDNEDLDNGTYCSKYYFAVEHPERLAYKPTSEDIAKLEEEQKMLEKLYRSFLEKYAELSRLFNQIKQKEVIH